MESQPFPQGTGETPPSRADDEELYRVADEIRRKDPTGARLGLAIRFAFDQAYDGRRTGRWEYTQLVKTEKTYLGTVIEVMVQRALDAQDGQYLDYKIADCEVDCKWSMNLYGWQIPREMYEDRAGRPRHGIALLIWGNDYTRSWAAGLIRITPRILRAGENRDQKRTLTNEGRDQILWLFSDERLESNILLQHEKMTLKAISYKSGQRAVTTMFRDLQGELINTTAVETLGQQIDSPKRVRDARKALKAEGIVILGHYQPHPKIASELGLPEPRLGEFVSARVTPWTAHDGGSFSEIGGQRWRLATPDDPVTEAPTLPRQGQEVFGDIL